MRFVLAIVFASSVAHADPELGIGVNNPAMWTLPGGGSYSLSGYVGLTKHLVTRVNVASYPYERIGNVLSEDGGVDGRTTDVSVGFDYFFLRRFFGPFVEVGALRRSSPYAYWDDDDNHVTGTKLEWAGTAMIGYSLDLTHGFWMAAAVGASYGHEHQNEDRVDSIDMEPPMHAVFDRGVLAGEWMFRLGTTI